MNLTQDKRGGQPVAESYLVRMRAHAEFECLGRLYGLLYQGMQKNNHLIRAMSLARHSIIHVAKESDILDAHPALRSLAPHT